MFEWCIKHPTQVSVIALLVCVLGTVAALRIPVQMIPDLDVRTISVVTRWPGATPQDVEKEILIEQEDYLQNVPGLQRMISSASMSSAEIELEFPSTIDVNDALIRVHLEEGRGTHQGRERPTPPASRSRMRTTLIKKVLDAAGPPFSASTWFFRERVVRD